MNEPMGESHASGFSSKWVAKAGVSTRMLRNFGILKRRLWRPTRSDQYSAGPGELRRTAAATISMGSSSTTVASKAKTRSKQRFTAIFISQNRL
jgi:hypothetical protein